MNKEEIIKIFQEKQEATIEMWELMKQDSEVKLKIQAARKRLQLARAAECSITFNN